MTLGIFQHRSSDAGLKQRKHVSIMFWTGEQRRRRHLHPALIAAAIF
jgi:hypothetical protein